MLDYFHLDGFKGERFKNTACFVDILIGVSCSSVKTKAFLLDLQRLTSDTNGHETVIYRDRSK